MACWPRSIASWGSTARALNRRGTVRAADIAATEIERAMTTMRIPGHPRPYYVSTLIRDERSWTIQAKYGSLSTDACDRKRNAYVDVRVGSYGNDQVRDGGLDDNDKDDESYGYVDLPLGDRIIELDTHLFYDTGKGGFDGIFHLHGLYVRDLFSLVHDIAGPDDSAVRVSDSPDIALDR